MKTLYVNYKSVVSTLVVLLMGLSVHLTGFAEVTPVSERTQQVQNAIVAALPSVTNASDVTETHLASITSLNLRNKDITALKSGDFSGLTGLTNLNLYGNQLSSLPNGIFEGLTALTTLRLGGNTTNPMLLTVSLEKVGDNQFKAVASIGAPFAIVLPVSATNGSISGDVTTLTISKGSVESDAVTVTRTESITAAVTANIGTLPSLPNNHYGYSLSKSDALPVEVISAESTPTIPSGADEIDTVTPTIEPPPVTPVTPDPPDEVPENNAPTFTEGAITKRSVAENTAANTNIGTAVSATDSDSGDILSYTLGVDAASFDIDSATGQLKTKAALDYETKRVYAVSITVSDGSLRDTISVIISVINKADTVLDTSILSVSDRTPQVRDAIVAAVPGVTDAADVTATHLAAIASLNLRNKDISALKSGDFSGLSSMTSLNLYGNMLSSLPNGIFAGLTSLTSLRLGGNTVSPMPLIVWLEQVSNDMYKVSIPAGAPFDVAVPVVLVDGVLRETLRTVTISKGSVNSDAFWVPVVQSGSIVIGGLPNLPSNHFGYVLTKSGACNLTPQVAAAITAVVPGVTDCRNLSETDLATITSLNLNNKSITSLRSDDFAALLSLTSLDLRNNQLSSLPDGIFSGLTGLTTLQLSGNTVDPILLTVSLEKVGTNMVRATLPTGAPFDIMLPITVANGSLAGSVSNLMIAAGSVESAAVVVLRASNTTGAVTANIGTLPSLPATHNGYALAKSTGLPLEILRRINVAPVFTAGVTATRSIAENTAAGTNIGSAISATDANSGNTLTYTLSGADASSFSIVSTSGQLRTKAALDYETKSSYTVTITVSDGSLTDSITVTINITDVDENRAPVFTAGTTTTRSIAENTATGVNIGTTVSATDADSDTLTYSLGGTDTASFAIDTKSGQLKTSAALDYETKSSYSVTITVSDGSLTDIISVTIKVTDVDEKPATDDITTRDENVTTPVNNAPMFTDGESATRTVAENTSSGVNIGSAVTATDAEGHTLTYSLSGTDAAAFSIDSSSGQLRTSASLDYETKSTYTATITVSDGTLTDSITVTIKVTDVDEAPSNNAPVFSDGDSTTLTVAENTSSGVNIGSAVSATDTDDDTLTYSLSGTDAAAFSIDSSSGQLRTSASLDYETKSTYTVTIIVSDGTLTDSITVTIKVTDVDEAPSNNAPVFSDGDSTTLTVAENTSSGVNIGSAVSATDTDDDTLTYSLGGTDAAAFSIDSSSGQLRTSASLDYETKSTYTVTIIVSDGTLTDSITVTIKVTDVDEAPSNNAPVFSDGDSTTLTVAENTSSGVNIGSAVSATDTDDDTLTYSLGGTDAAAFSIDSSSGQLRTSASLDYETKSTYTVTIIVSDGTLTDSITVTIKVTDVDEAPSNNAPVFSDGDSTTLTVAENTSSGVNIGSAVSATDTDDDTLTYSLGGTDATAFSIDTATGQLKTKAALNYETKSSYTVTVTASDGSLTDSINVTINVTNVNEAPIFSDGTTTTRAIAENVGADINIGTVVAASDVDSTNLTYSLSGTDAAAFSLDTKTGQLKTKATLDYETKTSYTVTITVSDGSHTDIITVTINVTNLDETPSNNAPVLTDGDSTTRSVAENSISGTNIGAVIAATDADNNTLAYLLSGTDASSFAIDSTNGQLKTSAALDHETKASYTVTVTVSDGTAIDRITVTITVTDVNEAPVFADGSSITLSIAENTATGSNIGSTLSATDPDDDTLTWTLGGADAASFSIAGTTRQLKTKSALDYETKYSYSVTITVSDGSLTDTITVTINVMDVDENRAPAFASDSTTRSVAENTGSGVDIGIAVAATDADGDELTYTLDGIDAAAFSIDNTSGQLRTKDALDYETKFSYTVTITVSDSSLMDSITVTINVMDVDENRAPAFASDSTTRSVAENTGSGVDIGIAVAATDADGDELTYTLDGIDAAAFSIDNTSGQLRTKDALDYETKFSYTVTITVSDSSLMDSITVTINVTDIDENRAPAFTSDSTTRSVAENTGSGVDIGTAVAATDADNDTLIYTLDGTDAAAFSIDSTSGQLRTKSALDYETKFSYSVTISVSDDNGGSDSITVTINVTDVTENSAPVFTDGASTTRSVAENTDAGTNIGTSVAATDADNDTLIYTLDGTDAAAFSIVSTSGQLRTKSALDYETKFSYSVTISVSDDNGGSDSITVTINVTDVTENSAPVFTDGASTTRSIAENTDAGTNIGTSVAATDADNDTLIYTLDGTDAAAFSINSTSGQLRTKSALDYETKFSYSVTISVSDDNGGSDSITVTINITDVTENSAPVFTDGASTTRSVAENTDAGTNIGTSVAATDADNDTLIYTLDGTDTAAFSIVSTSGQLRTKSALDYETKFSYSVTISVSDDNGGSDSITVTINVTDVTENSAPVFTDGASTTRSIAENTDAGTNIGTSVAATDADNDTLIYTLDGTDTAAFSIDSTSGQLKTRSALDYETKFSYSVTISVSDDNGGSDSITVTINITDVTENSAPVFTDGASTTRSIAENTAAGTNIGTSVAATDADNDTLIYTLEGTNSASFAIVITSGQLQTKAALNYERKHSYSVIITVSDSNGGTDSITVTINITDVANEGTAAQNTNSAPTFTEGAGATRSVAENTAAGTNIGTAVAATDADNDELTYTLGGTNAASFSIVSTSGQLKTKSALDYETKFSYSVTILVSDGNGGSDSITVTINITDVTENSAPVFTDGDSVTRSIDEVNYAGTAVDTYVDLGSPIDATDADNDTLTYSFVNIGNNSDYFSINSSTGQLSGRRLDYEIQSSFTLTIKATDSNNASDTITVTVTINDINEVPTFSSDAATTLTVQEGTAASTDLGSAYTAYDFDDGDTITFSLAGTDASSFQINSSSTQDYTESSPAYSVFATGQLQTNASLDYAKNSYSVDVVATDTAGLTKTTSITINVVEAPDVGEAPDPAVSSRTQAVQDAIVAAVSGVSSASDITGEHLLGITSLSITGMPSLTSLSTGDFNGMNNLGTLDLSGNGLSSFPDGISGLGSLTSLDLSGNQLPTYLPDGIFSGLSLDTLDLSGNTGNPTIVLSIEKVTHSENDALNQYYRVKVNTGAPFGFTLQLHAYSSGVNLRYGPRVPISAGSIYSDNRKAISVAPGGSPYLI